MSRAPRKCRPRSWYADGLHFRCTRCGDCCGGEPGYIWVTPDDVRRMAEAIGMDLQSFLCEHVREVAGRLSLKERPDGYCVMWEPGRGCRVYTVRPVQCSAYPWWTRILRSRDSWEAEGRRCPGINHGRRHDLDTIRRRLWDNG
ncbi:MAG: YkgJ family cysteine cluster protein [Planctomycetota bacterium]